jgi:hypothetical protein
MNIFELIKCILVVLALDLVVSVIVWIYAIKTAEPYPIQNEKSNEP